MAKVGEDVDALAVRAEGGVGVRDGLARHCRAGLRRDWLFVTGTGVDEPKVTLIGRYILPNEELPVVRRPGDREPGAIDLHQHVLRWQTALGIDCVHHPQIGVLVIAPSGGKDELRIMVREQEAIIAAVPVCQERDSTCREIVAIDLIPLAAPRVFLKEKGLAVGEILGTQNAIFKKSELPARAARHDDGMDLRGVTESGADENLAARGMPGEEG